MDGSCSSWVSDIGREGSPARELTEHRADYGHIDNAAELGRRFEARNEYLKRESITERH
jgi:hypothetical protein